MKTTAVRSVVAIGVFLLSVLAVLDVASDRAHVRRLKTSGARQALDFWANQRAYPERAIPGDRYAAQFDRVVAERRRIAAKSHITDTWRTIGPHNIGGRTLALAFNPLNSQTIYAGSASGGLWRTHSSGVGARAWHRVTTGHPVLGVSSIAIMPTDSNTIIIGTGEVNNYQKSIGGVSVRNTRGSYGIGILKTTNNGVSWTKTLDWSTDQQRGVWAVKIHPVNHQLVWAATTEGVLKSTDAGATWSASLDTIMGTDLALHPTDENIVYATFGNFASAGHGIYRTTNGGTTWTKLTGGLPATFGGKAQLAMFPDAPNIVYASIGNGDFTGAGTWLCRSTDAGETWETLTTLDYSTYQGWYSHAVAVHPTDTSVVYAVGIDIFKSTNGGRSLTQRSYWFHWYLGTKPQPGEDEGSPDYSHADHHAILFHPTNPDTVYFATDGGVFRTLDGGLTFQGCNGGLQTSQFYNGFSSSPVVGHLAVGGMQDNATAVFEGELGWRREIGGDGCMTAIHPFSPDTAWGSYQYLGVTKLIRQPDSTFQAQFVAPPGGSANTSFVGPFVVSPSHPNILYAGRNRIFKSIIGGGAWATMNDNNPLDGNPVLMLAVSHTNPDTVYATTAPVLSRGRVFRSTDGGASWGEITGTLPDRYYIDIAVDPSASSKLFIALSGFGTSHIYRSTDAGTTWEDAGVGLPDVPTSAVAIDPFQPSHVYAGNDIGVFVSTNSGASWSPWMDDMPEAAIIMDLSVSIPRGTIRAVTHGNGVYERTLVSDPVGVEENDGVPLSFVLAQNYPNPFNAETTIRFAVPYSTNVRVAVYDASGRRVALLADGERSAGSYAVRWNASGVASGVYFCRLETASTTLTRKVTLVK